MKEVNNENINEKEEVNTSEVENENLEEKDNLEEVLEGEILEDIEFESSNDNVTSFKDEITKLKNENSKLNNELDTLKERILRLNAEYDNFRKRTSKEKEGIYTEACEDVLKEIFPVLDNLERAVTVDGSVDDLKKGVDMTIRQFKNAFEKIGVEEIEANGEFDPNLHQAVMHIEDENLGNNTIAEVFQKGYKKGSKVLRFTMVKVAN
ncbi:nucleotide exchange factor GrpE [Clostridium folliculivorans]|uniref:Protein GrpE n=1 Tax=Clostridium folliculivorans TaxID=2886038 RepID=A0A9W5XZ64_9CLOT|nr:nucleotide exchange factor GrpE [Clostridium folliculivorans]GKU23620.1 protein GrpE [Clostridium folliculivorans]GKU29736.1 protein GrpE [Clostridium folliculivorans]